jgi:hypothetical protein
MKINPTTFPISWFRDRNIEKTLVLKPPYQRKPVWTVEQKAYLIDTILKGYLIPEIYIHRETDEGGKTIFNIVDGQQRIRSILDFLNNEFTVSEEYSPEYSDYNFEDFPLEIKQTIWDYTLYAREITNATEEEVRNLFKRMNKNVVALNSQELRHATYSGAFIKTMEEIAEDEFWTENKIVTPNEIRRMKDVQYISDLYISMLKGIQDKTKEMDDYYKYYEENGFEEKFKTFKTFQNNINLIVKIFPNVKDTRWKNKSDFYTLFMVINEIGYDRIVDSRKIKSIRKELDSFSKIVMEATKKENKAKKYSKDIAMYVNAVTKSTTDKDRRIIRHKIIKKTIIKYLK